MGVCGSCFRASDNDIITPDAETRRKQLIEAAEQRRREEERRGVKDVDKVKRMQEKTKEIEQREMAASKEGEPTLRWTAN